MQKVAKGPHPEFEVLWIMDFSQATHSRFCNACDHSQKFTSFVLLVYIVWVLRIKSVLSFCILIFFISVFLGFATIAIICKSLPPPLAYIVWVLRIKSR